MPDINHKLCSAIIAYVHSILLFCLVFNFIIFLNYTYIGVFVIITSGKIISLMKGDVGMSVHEKEGKQVNATPTHKTIYNPIPTSL